MLTWQHLKGSWKRVRLHNYYIAFPPPPPPVSKQLTLTLGIKPNSDNRLLEDYKKEVERSLTGTCDCARE